MDFKDTKVSTRGPLIAVIKIEISLDKTDRIFLHQNDNDYQLAQQFTQKHKLKPTLVEHIFRKIQLSRAALNKQPQHKTQYRENKINESSSLINKLSNYQYASPSQSFKNELIKDSQPKSNIGYGDTYNYFQKVLINQKNINNEYNYGQSSAHKRDNQLKYSSPTIKQAKQEQQMNHQEQYKQIKSSINRHQLLNKPDYSFQNEKPSHVRIIHRNQLSSIQSSMKRSISKSQLSKINKDVTNRLYNESQIKKNYLNKIKIKANHQEANQAKQNQQLTYHPQINPISRFITQDRFKDKPVYEHLIQQGRKSEAKRENSKSKLQNKQVYGCSFQPQINAISRKLTAGRSMRALSAKPECKKSHKQGQFEFRPKINKVSQRIVQQKGNFDQRLRSFLETKNMKLSMKAQQKQKSQKFDHASGQKLFKPKILSTSSHIPQQINICQYLYNLSKEPKQLQPQQKKIKINQTSQSIVQQMYIKRLAWLFAQLDSDQDGLISPKRICIDTIDDDLLQVITPVLFQMQQMNIELTLQDFRRAISNLHPSLNSLQKSILYNYKKKKIQ